MPTNVRASTLNDYPRIRDLFTLAFPTDDEAQLWDHLVAHDSSLRPEGVRVAIVDGRPVACTVVLPRQVRTRTGFIPGAVVTLVACDPAYQNQGFGGLTVRDALQYMDQQGLAVGVLLGHPGYYPRFGFVPVLGHPRTVLAATSFMEPGVALRFAEASDSPWLAALYEEQLSVYPCSVARSAEPWEWRPRTQNSWALLTLANRQGYAFVGRAPVGDHLHVVEVAASHVDAARDLLAGLCGEAKARGLERIRIDLPPDQLLARVALMNGAEQIYKPAAPGMACIVRWDEFLPEAYRVVADGLVHGDRLVLRADRAALTQLILGYRSVDDLLLTAACTLAGNDGDLVSLRRDFPPTYPTQFLAPFWY